MSKEPIIFIFTSIEMLDHLLFARPVSPVKVMRLKASQQQFSLIEPGSVRRCDKRPHPGISGEKLPRHARDGARPSIPDQVNAPCLPVFSKQLRQDTAQVLAVVPVQTPAPHLPAVEYHSHQEVDRIVTVVLKLLMFDLALSHQPSGCASAENLNAGLLVQSQRNLVPFFEPINSLVNPENAGCPLSKFLIENRRLPVPESVRLQGCGCKEAERRIRETVECAIRGTMPLSTATLARERVDQWVISR